VALRRVAPDLRLNSPRHHDDRDALLLRVGRLIASDPVLTGAAWDGYALIVEYGEDASRRIAGFRYLDGGGFEAATPRDAALGDALDALREATRIEGEPAWGACVVQLRRDSGRLHADFEYDDPARWAITPQTLSEVAERARPQD
jgi:hypothetical protein